MLPGMSAFLPAHICFDGIKRTAYAGSAIGMHQHYYEEPVIMPAFWAVENIQLGQGLTMQYLIEMGVEPELMIYSLNTPPDEIYILVENGACDQTCNEV